MLLASCGAPPETDQIRARTALLQAQKAQAGSYAPATFKAGQQELEKAETEVLIQLSRPRAFRRFSEAQLRFQRAGEALRSALQESLSRQQELQQQVEENLREFERIGSEMERQLAELPDKFIDKKQIAKALDELNSLRAEVPAIQQKLESGDHRSAYHAASNLRVRESLLYRETYNRVEERMVASIH
jgi:NAD-dependent DNA ligase